MVGVTTTWGTVLKGYCIRKVEKHCPTEIHECISFFPAPGPPSSHCVSAGLLRLDLSFTICSVAPVFLMEAVAIWNSLLCLFVLFVILLLFWGKNAELWDLFVLIHSSISRTCNDTKHMLKLLISTLEINIGLAREQSMCTQRVRWRKHYGGVGPDPYLTYQFLGATWQCALSR